MICRGHQKTCMVCGAPVPHLDRVFTRKDLLNVLLAMQATDMDFKRGIQSDSVGARKGELLERNAHNFLNELALRLTRGWETGL